MLIQNDYIHHAAALDVSAMRPVDLFDAWLFAEVEAALALGAWCAAADTAKGDAFATYRAALDREEQAASVLALRLAADGHRASACRADRALTWGDETSGGPADQR